MEVSLELQLGCAKTGQGCRGERASRGAWDLLQQALIYSLTIAN